MRLRLWMLSWVLLSPVTAAAEAPWLSVNLAMVEEHVVPRYEQLAEAARGLEQHSRDFCAAPDQARLAALREQFHDTMDGWAGVQHLRFGPVELLNRYYRFQLWPDKHNTGTRQLARLLAEEDHEVLAPQRFARTSVAVQGLSALERLVFARGKGPEAFVQDGKANYRCQLVEAISHNLANMSAELAQEWRASPPPLAQLFLQSGELIGERMKDKSLAEKRDVTAAFFSNLTTQVQSIIDQKLLRPMGEPGARAKPRYLESWRSERSLRNIVVNLEALESLYDTGFAPLLEAKSAEHRALDKKIRQAFAKAHQAARQIAAPLYQALQSEEQPLAVEQLLQGMRQLQTLLTGPLPDALGIPLGFNALDGD